LRALDFEGFFAALRGFDFRELFLVTITLDLVSTDYTDYFIGPP